LSAPRPASADRGADVFAQSEFTAGLEQHRADLHVHCYRMLASFTDADDVMHEIAWRASESPDVYDSDDVGTELIALATNTCLDALRRRTRRITDIGEVSEGPWLTPYPDRVLDPSVTHETIGLPYITALQVLPARQRAVLLLRDVQGWSGAATASALELSAAAVSSALQRARTAMRQNLADPGEPAASAAEVEGEVLAAYIDSYESRNVSEAIALMREDIVVTTPPEPVRYVGLAEVSELFGAGFTAPGEWTVLPTAANRSPAVACYLREPGDPQARICRFDVLRVADGRITEITTFGRALADQFGVPEHL
jgi:RNA polymerase sigma-70 factor (ECF subfamily)